MCCPLYDPWLHTTLKDRYQTWQLSDYIGSISGGGTLNYPLTKFENVCISPAAASQAILELYAIWKSKIYAMMREEVYKDRPPFERAWEQALGRHLSIKRNILRHCLVAACTTISRYWKHFTLPSFLAGGGIINEPDSRILWQKRSFSCNVVGLNHVQDLYSYSETSCPSNYLPVVNIILLLLTYAGISVILTTLPYHTYNVLWYSPALFFEMQ